MRCRGGREFNNFCDLLCNIRDDGADRTCTVFREFVAVPFVDKCLQFAAQILKGEGDLFSISGMAAIASFDSDVKGTFVEAT